MSYKAWESYMSANLHITDLTEVWYWQPCPEYVSQVWGCGQTGEGLAPYLAANEDWLVPGFLMPDQLAIQHISDQLDITDILDLLDIQKISYQLDNQDITDKLDIKKTFRSAA